MWTCKDKVFETLSIRLIFGNIATFFFPLSSHNILFVSVRLILHITTWVVLEFLILNVAINKLAQASFGFSKIIVMDIMLLAWEDKHISMDKCFSFFSYATLNILSPRVITIVTPEGPILIVLIDNRKNIKY